MKTTLFLIAGSCATAAIILAEWYGAPGVLFVLHNAWW